MFHVVLWITDAATWKWPIPDTQTCQGNKEMSWMKHEMISKCCVLQCIKKTLGQFTKVNMRFSAEAVFEASPRWRTADFVGAKLMRCNKLSPDYNQLQCNSNLFADTLITVNHVHTGPYRYWYTDTHPVHPHYEHLTGRVWIKFLMCMDVYLQAAWLLYMVCKLMLTLNKTHTRKQHNIG